MRVVFYDCGFGALGVQYLLRVLETAGHDVQVFFDQSFSRDYLAQDLFLRDFLSLTPEQVRDSILALDPEVLCLSVFSYTYQRNMALVRVLKEANPNLIVVCGGCHATLLPEVALENEGLSFVVVGEGEISLPALMDALANSDVATVKALPEDALPGVWNVHDGAVMARGLSPIMRDLDQIPFPDKTQHYAANPSLRAFYSVVASRGCTYACTYCNSPCLRDLHRKYNEPYYRLRSVENVIAEIEAAVAQFHPRHVAFLDDAFGVKRPWLREFASRYKEAIGLPYDVETSPASLDAEALDLLAGSGCVNVEIGFQCANATVRRELLNRHETNEQVEALIRGAKSRGMFVELDTIVNLPGETEEHIEETLEFIRATRPHLVNVGFLQYFPKAPITQMALDQGVLNREDIAQIERGGRVNSMRLLSQSGLGARYRVLPFQVAIACRLPRWISGRLIPLVRTPILRNVFSFFASPFLYASRIRVSLMDRRQFFLRRQVIRSLYAARWVLARKLRGVARP